MLVLFTKLENLKKKKKSSLLENFHLTKQHFQGFAIFIPC